MAKYTADQLKALGAKGQAFKNPDGSFSYPYADAEDLGKAILAVGRGGASHDALRKYIMARAKALGLTSKIPDNWNSDGSMRGAEMAEVERRFTPGVVELRATEDAKRIGGYAAVFGPLSRNLGGFVERVEPGALNQSRASGWPNVVARYNHDGNMLLGTIAGRTLDLRIDTTGLWYEVLPPAARADILELVQRGDVQHSSFAFRVVTDDWTTTDQNYPMRSLQEVQLVDVAPVITPAYPDATAGLRSLAEHFSADVEEVRSLAEADDLRKFFVRTDTGAGVVKKPQMFAASAAAQLLARRQDPWA
jgi:HK97 family phage prohead protease